jgi:hypothetical protein
MRFGRKPTAGRQDSAPTDLAPAVPAAADDGNLPLIDMQGHAFELLRSIDLGHALWRPNVASDLDHLGEHQIVVVAAYAPEDIESSRPLMQRFMTIVLAMGLGPRYGSRALTLGAVGYIDGSANEGDIRSVFGDAVARVRIRRLREPAA